MYSHLSRIDGACISAPVYDTFALPGIGTWTFVLQTERLSWRPVVLDIFGLPRDEAVERRDTVNMYVEPFRFMLERQRSAAIATRGAFSLEAPIIRPNGEERWVRLKAATKVQNGHAVGLYGIKEDITEERTSGSSCAAWLNTMCSRALRTAPSFRNTSSIVRLTPMPWPR